ncbi:hypothetical protein, partial [Shigella boydii]|uniref:hypothetical protein n=1 Tax=Shigella boydii TaxID=621 RepID=UPI001C0A7920
QPEFTDKTLSRIPGAVQVITAGQGETIYKVKEILLLRSIPYTPFSHKKSHVGFASYPEHGSRLRLAECLADR